MRPGNRVFSGSLVGVSFVGALDAYNVVLAVSSARRLLTSYTGSIARIRSTGAGTPELDFGYDAAGMIDTAGIASFLGVDSGVFRYLYDQKGTNHFGQSSAASQPAYNATGLNSRPTAQFDGSNDGMKTVGNISAQSTWWGYVVSKPLATGSGPELWAIVSYPDTAVSYRLWERNPASSGATEIYYNNSGGLSSSIAYPNNTAVAHVLKGSVSSRYAKGSNGVSISDGNNNTIIGGYPSTIGYRNDSSAYFNGHICEVVLGSGTLTSQQETDLFTQLNAFWGTPIP